MSWIDQLGSSLSVLGLALLFCKASVIILVCLYVSETLSHNSATDKHRIYIGTVIALAFLPIVTLLIPNVYVPLIAAGAHNTFDNPPLWLTSAVITYILVASVLGIRLLAAVFNVAWITSTSVPADKHWQALVKNCSHHRRVRVLTSKKVHSPISWGAHSPVILVPTKEAWSASERQMIVHHELAHIYRGDWFARLLGEMVAVLYWPIPWIRRVLENQSLSAEQACDDFVLQQGAYGADYAALLLKQVQRCRSPASLALADPSELGSRIRNICATSINHEVSMQSQRWLYPVCLLAVLPIAAMQPGFRSDAPLQWERPPALSISRSTLAVDEDKADKISQRATRPIALPEPPVMPAISRGDPDLPSLAATYRKLPKSNTANKSIALHPLSPDLSAAWLDAVKRSNPP
ncbi:MAG: M56 family metallopeptidase [Pseudomonadota bacterium]